MKDLSVEDQIYLCKYHDVDKALHTTLGLRDYEVEPMLNKLKQNGLYEQYRKMPDEEYEKIIKKKPKKQKVSKADDIVEKYCFDRRKTYFGRVNRILQKCEKIKEEENLNLNALYDEVAKELSIKPYVIPNDCRVSLAEAYEHHKDIFRNAGYYKRPSFKDFIVKEFGMKRDVQEENTIEIKANEITLLREQEVPIKVNGEPTITVPIKVIYEYYYLKGFLDAKQGNSLAIFQ